MLTWVKTTSADPLPEKAIFGGISRNGSPIYIGRAHQYEELIPGRIDDNILYIGTRWEEHKKTEYEILCSTGVRWIKFDGIIPPNAIQAGNRGNAEPLMIVRTSFKGALTVGKLHASERIAYFPYDGKEYVFSDFEILVKC